MFIARKPDLQSPVVLSSRPAPQYRVWLFAYSDWQPVSCVDLPTKAVAVEEAEPRTFNAEEAVRYVKAFNRTALRSSADSSGKLWAVAFPVTVFYCGEPRPGQRLLDGIAAGA